ncbi:hypothetical protein M9458_043636, partial [Cirrhinus mrigala]
SMISFAPTLWCQSSPHVQSLSPRIWSSPHSTKKLGFPGRRESIGEQRDFAFIVVRPATSWWTVRLQWAATSHNCLALVDSGAEGNFMDIDLALRLHIPIFPLTHKIFVNALNGQTLPDITHTTGQVTLITSGNHSEKITLLLTSSALTPIVLGHPWLVHHNPWVDWGHNSNESVNLSNVPKEYLDLKEVFSKSRATSLPPHRPYDCAPVHYRSSA